MRRTPALAAPARHAASLGLALLAVVSLAAPARAAAPGADPDRPDPDDLSHATFLSQYEATLRLRALVPHVLAPRTVTPERTTGTAVVANLLVNSKAGDFMGSAQVEPSVALAGPLAVCAFNTDKLPLGGEGMQTAFAPVPGGPWTTVMLPPPMGPTSKWTADPVVTANEKTLDFWFSGLFSPSGSPSSSNGVAVVHGVPGPGPSIMWLPPVVVRSGPTSSLLVDKDWMVADSSSGNLYLCYTTFATGTDSIIFQRSTDGGASWSTPLTIAAASPALVQGSRVAVGPAGEVYVTWFRAAGPPDSMLIRKSVDHGLTFGPRKLVAAVYSNFDAGAPGSNLLYAPNFPAIAVDRSLGPHRGRVYESWAEAVNYTDDTLGAGGPTTELEPNGAIGDATPFTPGAALIGTFASGDVDTWSFIVPDPPKTYIFKTTFLISGMGATQLISCADSLKVLSKSVAPTGIASGKPNIAVFSPQTGGVYFFKMMSGGGPGSYEVDTGVNEFPPTPGHGMDERDVLVAHSDDGATWSGPTRANVDVPGADQIMPEIAVSAEGYVYGLWLDYSAGMPEFCPAGSGMTLARSTDGGASFMPSPTLTSAPTEWWSTATDIAPNQGDYQGLCAGASVLCAWTDGRLGDPDIFSAGFPIVSGVSAPADSAWVAGSAHTLEFTVSNTNPQFPNSYGWTATSARAWPGFPASGSFGTGPVSSGAVDVPLTIPDSAAAGPNAITLTVTPLGASSAMAVMATVVDTVATKTAVAAAPAGLRFGIDRAWPNPSAGRLHVAFTLPASERVTLELLDLSGRRLAGRALEQPAPGSHDLDFTRESAGLRPGLYWLRLVQGARVATARVALLR